MQKHFDEVEHIIKSNNFDVFCLSETWLHDKIENEIIEIDGYMLFRKDRTNKRGGGVAIYVRNDFQVKPQVNLNNSSIEALWVNIKLKSIGQVLISCMYREPNANDDYYDDMLDNIECALSHNENIIILGDLNYDYKIDENLCRNPLFYIESLYGLKQLIDSPTRVTVNSSTTLDVILTSIPEFHKSSGVIPVTVSDHYLVYTDLIFNAPEQKHQSVRFRDYKNFNAGEFNSSLSDALADISDSNFHEPEVLWSKFKETFLKVSGDHAPFKTMRLKERNNRWITKEIISLMYKRDYIQVKAVENKSNDLWSQYTELRNHINRLTTQSKELYFADMYKNCKHDSKKLFKEIQKVFPSKQSKTCNIDISSNVFNDAFVSIGEKVEDKFKSRPNVAKMKGNPSLYSFHLAPVKIDSVLKNLKEFNLNSSNDILDFDSKLLRISAVTIAPLLVKIFNLSINKSIILEDFKLARVTPIYKGKGHLDDPLSFRPISVTCHISKLFEREINTQLYCYLEKHSFISTDQSAYIKYHSTVTALHRIVDDWLQNIDDGNITAVCFLDVEKCFNSINHNILIEKLKWYGLDEQTINLFRSYLYKRKQAVYHNDELSDWKEVNIGVPQGSVLGPLLFLIFVNDLPSNVGNSVCNMFADDADLYIDGTSIDEVNKKLQECIDIASQWYEDNKLSINGPKSNVMLVSSRYMDVHDFIPPVLNGSSLSLTTSTRVLGITVDQHIKWDEQVANVCANVSNKLYTLSKLRKFLNKDLLAKIYLSCIQPHIEYAYTVWGDCPNKDKLQRLQNRAARIITGNFDYVNIRGINLVKSLGWSNCMERYKYLVSTLMFKCIHGLAPDYLSDTLNLESDVSVLNTRSSCSLNARLPPWRTTGFKKAFVYNGPLIWNSLPKHIKESLTLQTFKQKCKQYFR